ncbi:AI-2E family transporter [Rhizosaccharibacter radicis]|uniref:AI-2E family transporter n=1 Tax=Rhizosaccharibacter radicis TaxID=2782605 RepID=A0ABT1VY96_9PROT|nr:AI-2E family transporter [Acetobacteraceae bacterium KSS12]
MSLFTLPTDQRAAEAAERRAVALERFYDLSRFVVAAAAIILAIWLLKDVLVVVFAATLLAVILHGMASLLHRHAKLPFWLSLLVVVLALIALLVGFVSIAGPGLGDQAVKLRQALGSQAGGLHERLSGTRWGRMVLEQVPVSLGGSKQGGQSGLPSGLAGSVAGFLGSAFGLFGTLAVVIIAALYLAASPQTYVNGALRLVPRRQRDLASDLAREAGRALWAWSAGQALDMLVVGLLSGLGLWAIGVPLALVLGVIAGLMNFVPYIGAIAGAVPAVIIAFSVGPTAGIETVGLYCVIQGFEGNVMAPLIQNRAVHLPPGLTILSQTAFGAILGIPGLIFATPLTAALLAVMTKATTPLEPEQRIESR